ncbi:MAG: hypothetical protein A2X77_01675 [Gammaproteobacteria bacterium GWE2_42_36]|nr:MAG: hypothetical protein A2X77_01675 [Gammaproteobacteria bacterium GWE2_42_36]
MVDCGGSLLYIFSMPRIFIYVPQQCYAVITPDTPEDVVGLCTDFLHVCSGVVVTANQSKYIFLCHADSSTNLFDSHNGLSSWIEQIIHAERRRGNGGEVKIKMFYDDETETSNTERYAENFEKLMRYYRNMGHQCEVVSLHVPQSPGIAIFRSNGNVIREGGVDIALLEGEYSAAGEAGKVGERFAVDGGPLRYCIGDVIRLEQQQQMYSPICIFNGEKLLSLAELQHGYSQVLEGVPREGNALR